MMLVQVSQKKYKKMGSSIINDIFGSVKFALKTFWNNSNFYIKHLLR